MQYNTIQYKTKSEKRIRKKIQRILHELREIDLD